MTLIKGEGQKDTGQIRHVYNDKNQAGKAYNCVNSITLFHQIGPSTSDKIDLRGIL